MSFEPHPGGGGPEWIGFTGRIEARFGQQMKRPVWLKPFATADLPTEASQGANEGALAYDDTLNALTFYNGSAWKTVGVVGAGAALTRTNDTNVTITLGGSPTTALLSATSLTVGWTGQLSADRGGTGIASYAVGDLIYASGSTTLSKLADVATGNALISGGVTTAPAWGKIGLTTHVSGTLPVANGGTGDTGTAWTTYTPTVAAGSGSFTSVAAAGAYKTIGKTTFVRIKVTITTNGTASLFWTVTAPFASVNAGSGWGQIMIGARTDAAGTSIRGQLDNNSSLIYVTDYTGAYIGGDGYVFNLTGVYEAA